MARKPISKKLRFEVFKRDEFRCSYCGAHPSESVLLELDHIQPVIDGGGNDFDNLITSCRDCNRGKGARPLSSIPPSLKEKSDEVAEREEQIRAYYKILEAQKSRRDEELWRVANLFMEQFSQDSIHKVKLASINTFLSHLNFYEVIEAMEMATRKMVWSPERCFRYFCGICWKKIKEGGE